MKKRTVEIMDTTLRDGEQTSGMSFSASEKLTISKLLIEELQGLHLLTKFELKNKYE